MAIDYLNLYPNGATVVSGSTPVYVIMDYIASLPSLTEFNSNSYIDAEWSYPRHELVSWNTSSDGTGTSYPVGYNAGMVNSGTSLYAIWETKYAINITYNNNSIYSSDSIPNSALIKTGGKFVANDIQVTVQIEEYDGSVTVAEQGGA